MISYRGVPEAGINSNHGVAAFWFEKAAHAGLASAQCNLGLLYMLGHGVRKDDRQAAHWISKAADGGLAPAQNLYGKFLQKGRGVRRSDARLAAQYFQKAVDQGDADAPSTPGGRAELTTSTVLPTYKIQLRYLPYNLRKNCVRP